MSEPSASVFESLYQEELYHVPSRVMVVIAQDWEQLSEESKVLLAKILGSVKLTLSMIQVVHQKEFQITLIQTFAPTHVIGFGSAYKFQDLYKHSVVDNLSIIMADDLDKLDDVKKKNLWMALRQMFQV